MGALRQAPGANTANTGQAAVAGPAAAARRRRAVRDAAAADDHVHQALYEAQGPFQCSRGAQAAAREVGAPPKAAQAERPLSHHSKLQVLTVCATRAMPASPAAAARCELCSCFPCGLVVRSGGLRHRKIGRGAERCRMTPCSQAAPDRRRLAAAALCCPLRVWAVLLTGSCICRAGRPPAGAGAARKESGFGRKGHRQAGRLGAVGTAEPSARRSGARDGLTPAARRCARGSPLAQTTGRGRCPTQSACRWLAPSGPAAAGG